MAEYLLNEQNIADLEIALKEKLENIEKLKERMKYLKPYECGIRKSTGEIVYFTYYLNSSGNASIDVYSATHRHTYRIDLDQFIQEYVEYAPTTKKLYPRK